MVEFDVKLKPKDLYRFNMYQTYTGSQGIVSIVIVILAAVMTITAFRSGNISYGVMYAIFFAVFLLYIPITLWTRANLTIKSNEVLSGTLHYQISEECIRVQQGEESGELQWDQIYKMITTKHNVLIYSGRKNAYIIPKEQIKEQYDEVKNIATKKLEKYRIRMK